MTKITEDVSLDKDTAERVVKINEGHSAIEIVDGEWGFVVIGHFHIKNRRDTGDWWSCEKTLPSDKLPDGFIARYSYHREYPHHLVRKTFIPEPEFDHTDLEKACDLIESLDHDHHT